MHHVWSTLFSLAFWVASTCSANSEVSDFQLKNCLPENSRCLRIAGVYAEGSQFANLYYFKNAEVTLEEKQHLLKRFKMAEGYIDLVQGKVLVIERNPVWRIESLISLDTLKLSVFQQKR